MKINGVKNLIKYIMKINPWETKESCQRKIDDGIENHYKIKYNGFGEFETLD